MSQSFCSLNHSRAFSHPSVHAFVLFIFTFSWMRTYKQKPADGTSGSCVGRSLSHSSLQFHSVPASTSFWGNEMIQIIQKWLASYKTGHFVVIEMFFLFLVWLKLVIFVVWVVLCKPTKQLVDSFEELIDKSAINPSKQKELVVFQSHTVTQTRQRQIGKSCEVKWQNYCCCLRSLGDFERAV